MIKNYANRMHQMVEVSVRRAWRHGLKNGDKVLLPEPEAVRVLRMGFAELVVPVEIEPLKPGAGSVIDLAPKRKRAAKKA